MALLKYQNSFRGVNNQSCVFLCANPASIFWEGCGCRQAGTLTSSISRGANIGRKQANQNRTESSTSLDKVDKQNGQKSKSKFHLPEIRMNVPLKMATMNKYITDTSRKILSSGLNISGKQNINNSATEEQRTDDSSAYSLEKTITKMNQSVLSFYDSTYVNESIYDPNEKDSTALSVGKTEVSDDELSNVPRSPSQTAQQTNQEFPTSSKAFEIRKRKARQRRAEKISRLSLESRTKALVQGVGSAFSIMSRLSRLEELCDHLVAHPECVWEASSGKLIPILLKLVKSPDKNLKGMANQCLSLMGHVRPLTSPGVRVLSIDGGGTRGLVAIEFLKALEKETGKRTYELFDYVCGVSTGALLAAMICLYKLPLDQCEQLYKKFSIRTFTRNRVLGTTKLVWNHGFYDTQVWEQILRKEMGSIPFIEFSRDPECPKMSAVSALVTPNRMKNHLFRTYNLPPGVTSQYTGDCKHKIWEVIRASSAAPGYFEPFTLGDDVHEDGGILTNNPTALGIHECRLLWEKEKFHCVLSLGTGRYEMKEEAPAKLSLKRRISTIVDSACDTEAVHHTLQDLLPSSTYYRFNPYLSEEVFLDETRVEKMELLQHDARMYNRRNKYKLAAVAERLVEKRRGRQKALDWMRKMSDNM